MYVPKVSVFIICYNQKAYISEAIESALNQDYANFEIIVSDDASKDGTGEIVAGWAKKHPDKIIALIGKENVGITRNCNRALRACTGEFITFFGGDDLILPGKITAQVDWFSRDSRRVLCGHAVQNIISDGSVCPLDWPSDLNEGCGPNTHIRHGMQLPAQSFMVRRTAMPKSGFDERIPMASDFLFVVDVLSGGGRYGYVDGIYGKYRIHDGNVTKNIKYVFRDLRRTYLVIARKYPEYRKICRDLIIRHGIYYEGVIYLRDGYRRDAIRSFIRAIKLKPFYVKALVRLIQALFSK